MQRAHETLQRGQLPKHSVLSPLPFPPMGLLHPPSPMETLQRDGCSWQWKALPPPQPKGLASSGQTVLQDRAQEIAFHLPSDNRACPRASARETAALVAHVVLLSLLLKLED